MASRYDNYQVAILCASPLDARAVVLSLDETYAEAGSSRAAGAHGDPNAYTTGRIGHHNVVIVHIPRRGKTYASDAAYDMKTSFGNIRLALIVGACSGVPRRAGSVKLGDVVIGTEVAEIDFGRQYEHMFRRKRGAEANLGPQDPDIERFTMQIEAERQQLMRRTSEYLTDIIERSGRDTFEELERPQAHFGLIGAIGSGGMPIMSPTVRDDAARRENVIAFETETAGAWNKLPCMVVKAIADWADGDESRMRQDYAAKTSAACAKAILEQWY
ncbi:hypothetical protein ABW21_db0200479 [Orbilia brochopaga]|nr:hypothetical protein ABW21_db0200479 [Drechslerella brochopaga]